MATTDTRVPARSRGHSRGAADPVLISKITPPEQPGWVIVRPRIDRLLSAGTLGPLTVVTGPPGAGKTMAITSWTAAHQDRGTLVWITLDRFDNRPRVFWSYAVAALRGAGIAIPSTWTAAGRRKPVGHEFLLRLASVLAAARQPVVLVIEDFHLLTDADVLDGLSYLLKNAVPGLHLVISSRTQLPLALHRYRLNGELAEIRAGDLAFTVAETSLLMAQHGIRLSADALETLNGRTEGWAAALRLAAMSMEGHPDPEHFAKELGAEDSAITGYLVEEVLNPQSAAQRDFLLRTSILDRICADIAADLSDNDKRSVNVLSTLAEANAFVQPLGNGWYRYHPLLTEIFRLKLRREFPGQLPDLHRRAARWYLRNGSLTEAVRHAAEAGDWQLAARMMLDQFAIGHLIQPRENRSMAMADIFSRMPADAAGNHVGPLLVAAAMDLSDGGHATGSTSLDLAENILSQCPAADEIPARLAAALIRMAACRKAGDLDAAIAVSARATGLLAEIPDGLLALHPEIRPQVLLTRGIVQLWAGDADEAAATLRAGIVGAPVPDAARERADCLGELSLVEALRGRLSRAVELAGETAGTAPHGDGGQMEPAIAAASAALAWVHLERYELRQAHDQLTLTDTALRAHPDRLTSAVASLTAAACRLAEGRAGGALEMISRTRQRWQPPPWLEDRLAVLESQACAAAGDLRGAVDVAARAESRGGSGATVALASAWLAADDDHAARGALAARAPERDQEPVSLDGWLIDARLSYGSGDAARGRRSLERALQLAEAELIRLPFARERTWLRPILRREAELARTYGHLLEPDPRSPGGGLITPSSPEQPPPLVVDPLSEREREVLERLSGMLSTAEIAAEMYISVNTVKTHLKSIYRKLSANHRGEAVRRARRLKLIS